MKFRNLFVIVGILFLCTHLARAQTPYNRGFLEKRDGGKLTAVPPKIPMKVGNWNCYSHVHPISPKNPNRSTFTGVTCYNGSSKFTVGGLCGDSEVVVKIQSKGKIVELSVLPVCE